MKNRAFNTTENPLRGRYNKGQSQYTPVNIENVFSKAIKKMQDKR